MPKKPAKKTFPSDSKVNITIQADGKLLDLINKECEVRGWSRAKVVLTRVKHSYEDKPGV